jgi:PAS domain S-box-containing protein
MPTEKILIVEDEPLTADFMRASLAQLGYGVADIVSTAEEAIRTVEQHEPDLVLMDIHLQGDMDGVEAARQIHLGSDIPVIFVTGDRDDRLLARSKVAEPLGYILKPFSIWELQSTIKTGLNFYHSTNKRNSEARQRLELQYRSLFENSIQGIFRITRSGKFIDANASFAELLGYESPKELLDLSAEAKHHFVQPRRYRELLNALRKSGFVKDFEFEVYRRDGTKVWLSQNTRAIQGGSGKKECFEGIVHDITERKAAEKSLKSLLARQTALIAAIPDIIMEVDLNRVYTWANRAGFEFFGDDVIGKEAASYFVGEQNTYDEVDPLWGGDENTIYLDSWQRRKDGQKRLLAWRCHVLKDPLGRVIGALSSARDVTDSRLAEEALRQSEERFRLITEHIDEVFWTSDLGNIATYISPAFERVWGFPREDLYGSVESFRKAIHPEDRERVVDAFALKKNGQLINQEYRIVRPDGSIRHIWDRGFPIPNETGRINRYVGVAQDITKWKRAEEDLKKSKDYLNQIINCIADPIFVKDRQHRFLLINDAVCATTGLRREEIIGRTLHDTLPKDLLNTLVEQENRVFQTGEADVSVDVVLSPNGHYYTLMSNKTLFTDEDGNKQLVCVLRDITDLKKAESERAEMEIQLRQAQKLEAIGQLAAGIAHEINTPTQYVSDNTRFLQESYFEVLKILKAYGRLLQANREGHINPELIADVEAAIAESDLDYLIDEAPKALTQSLEGLNRVTTIVQAMKEFSHPDTKDKQTIDLNHAITNTITVCRNEWKYVAEMALDLDPTLPLVLCLPGDLNQVILNLVVNAAHAIADAINGDETHKGTISISTRHDGDCVEIRIGDTGTGIPEKHRAKIFTPFFTTKEVGKGTGQGLAICHSVIVGKHGGTVDFETEVGKGTVFIIRLPLRPDSI